MAQLSLRAKDYFRMPNTLYIATRKSPLALKQTAMAHAWLANKLPEQTFKELQLSTKVDERLSWSLEKRGDIGLFTKELEDALLDNRAQLAVHSAKDLPTRFQADLEIAGYLPRARANDILITKTKHSENPKLIATSSPRRRAQLAVRFLASEWTTIRGNVSTRLRKIAEESDEQPADATLLAAAGLDRLEVTSYDGLQFETLPVHQMVPAPGQAAIAIQCRSALLPKFEQLFCEKTKIAVSLERGFLRKLGGGCQTPIGAHFDGKLFHIFHPTIGYNQLPLTLDSTNEIEDCLDTVFSDLKL